MFPREAVYLGNMAHGAMGFHIHAANDTIGQAWEIQARSMATAYAQLAAADTIEIVSASGDDTTQKVTVFGVNSAGNRVYETGTLNGATAVDLATTFSYIENAYADKECAGIVTVRRNTGATFIMEVPVGELNSQVCQHFNGQYRAAVTMFGANLEDLDQDCLVQLRWYPDDADCLDSGDGYEVLDRIPLYVTEGPNPTPHIYPQPIILPAGGWLSAWVYGQAASANASVTIQGYNF